MDRMRGWLPEKPKQNRTAFFENAKADNPQGQSANQSANHNNIWMLLILFVALPLNLLLFEHYFSPVNFAATITAGVSVGAIVGLMPSYRELKILDKQSTSTIKLSTAVIIVLSVIDMCLIIGVVFTHGFPFGEFQATIIIFSAINWYVGIAGRQLLFAGWQRKKRIEIRVGAGFRIFYAPNSFSAAKLAADQQNRG
jgi:hypothetical protein